MAADSNNTQYQTYLPPDLTEQVEGMREQHDLKKSEVTRRLIQRGVEADSRAQRLSEEFRGIGRLLSAAGFGAFLVGIFWPGIDASATLVLSMAYLSFGAGSLLASEHFAPEDL